MKKSRIDDLEIYQTALELSNKIWRVVVKWNHFEKSTVGNQLVRSIDSVGANISEGYGRGSKSDNARFVKIARGSLFETNYWITQAKTRNLISDEEFHNFVSEIENLLPRVSSYIKYLGK